MAFSDISTELIAALKAEIEAYSAENRNPMGLFELLSYVQQGTNDSTAIGTVTPTLTSATSSGTITAGAYEVSVANIGTAAGTLLGTSFPKNAIATFSVPGATLAEIAYDATGTTFLISVIR